MTTDFGGADYANAVAADGVREIVAGASDGDFALARYGPHGTLDSSFGAGGKVTTDFGSGDDYATSVAVRPRGRIVVAGHTRGGFALARYRPDGMLDPSFSHNGKVRTHSNYYGAQTEAIDSRDRIVVADGRGAFVLYRYIGYRRR